MDSFFQCAAGVKRESVNLSLTQGFTLGYIYFTLLGLQVENQKSFNISAEKPRKSTIPNYIPTVSMDSIFQCTAGVKRESVNLSNTQGFTLGYIYFTPLGLQVENQESFNILAAEKPQKSTIPNYIRTVSMDSIFQCAAGVKRASVNPPQNLGYIYLTPLG